ncbi:hypothetical protein [Pseudomonas sp. CFBP 13727]|uniref:hypothetical protein n=1 Tax=Pseudomonas sp. CFBP 13727 TaxID=2775295 RepID=UPI00178126C9|nr:hypothetical protein [Pseudomonas sp. CFBP 13727]MBD8622765.1 hypothetical protein [Pseudomonas sp. CFBP 13727]
MGEAWNLQALRAQVRVRHPEASEGLIQIINSLGRSCEIFDYHKCLARDAFAAFNPENDPHGLKFAEQIFGCEDEQHIIEKAKLISEANLIACIAITRNSFDSFGQLLNGLLLPTPLTNHFYVHSVKDKLPDGDLKTRLDEVLSSDWFRYVHAFMNEVKHHRLIVQQAKISFVDENRGGKIKGFSHKGKDYPACWVREALEGTVELQNSLGACGILLNRAYFGEANNKSAVLSSTTEKQKAP